MAYNSERVLPRQMEALLRQTRPLQEIIVVDNASTDTTAKMLAQRFPQVTVLRMPRNLGAGGALEAGIGYAALTKRHDWVWTFDDDSVPEDDALWTLLNGTVGVQLDPCKVGMMAPLPIHADTGICYPPLLWHDGFVKPSANLLKQSVWLADLVFVSGCLVRREVVEEVGLPRADFFMDFIDFEYCLRVRSRGYHIAVVNKCKLAHEVGNARWVRLPGFSALWPDHAPWREYYMSRNITYAAWSLYPSFKTKQFVVKHLARHAGGVLLFGSNKMACLNKMMQGFSDGLRARLGTRFLPGAVQA
jgi:GT2 family glycosyltransferase